jgi:limonene-1,2-epoxide hydrolase
MLSAMAESMGNPPGTTAQVHGDTEPAAVVKRFLELLEANDVDAAVELLAIDVRYENVGLPTVHGRERVRRLFRAMTRVPGAGFEAYMHTVSADGSTVMTERTDVLKIGRFVVQLWVCGRFDIHDGKITLWRDYFDQLTFVLGFLRGLVGAVVPAVRARPPVSV